MQSTKPNVYDIVTERILAQIDKGCAPWKRPWGTGNAESPRNIHSGKAYRGVNVWLLVGAPSPWWGTYKQVADHGGNVRKGEHGTPIVFWNFLERENPKGDKERIPCPRYYTVFNASQCDGLVLPSSERIAEFVPVLSADAIVDGYQGKPPVQYGGDRACYSPARDLVCMPVREAFDSPASYYATLFHEYGHSTGHISRLKREGVTKAVNFASHTYGKEELIAELCSSFLCGQAGIEPTTLENSASYLAHWRDVIKADNKLFMQAASAAQKAADLILGKVAEHEEGAK